MGHQWFVLIALLLAAAKAKATVPVYPATVSFTEKYGDTAENFDVTFEYCGDYTGDNKLDVKVTVAIQPQSIDASGSEDVIGVAFDINGGDPWPNNLQIPANLITRIESDSSFPPTSVVANNGVYTGGQGEDLDFNIAGDIPTPYDAAVQVSARGSGEGTVKSFSFIITRPGTDLDGPALLSNTNWYFRTQSTNGGGGSAKTGGDAGTLPACECAVRRCATAQRKCACQVSWVLSHCCTAAAPCSWCWHPSTL
ncbi:hypothetical protein COO60DRAFT_616995 [Scenedesmus sp. NREL 46B-D3]|nr:hypothetical protein COO60DRAFT_616995 [Scenedesmus sp. NREL 46B-D3]